MIRLC